MVKIKQIALAALLSLGCKDIGWTTQECVPEMKTYFKYSFSAISRNREALTRYIEKNVDQELQKISPELVLDYLFYGEFDFHCGFPNNERTAGYYGYYIDSINSGREDLMLISTPYFQPIYEESIRPYEKFLNEDGTFNFEYARNIIKQDGPIAPISDGSIIIDGGEGFNKSVEANINTSYAIAKLAAILVHEATHGTWYASGLDGNHKCKDGICSEKRERSKDPFYQYGFKVNDFIMNEALEVDDRLNKIAFSKN